jgi:hypothetical protein
MVLENMPAGKLQTLRAEVEAMIATKVAARREELQSQLAELLKINGHGNGHNTKNADEVWSGRGRMPLWLGAQIKAGKDRDDFLIA